jgi:hypothetical protein
MLALECHNMYCGVEVLNYAAAGLALWDEMKICQAHVVWRLKPRENGFDYDAAIY